MLLFGSCPFQAFSFSSLHPQPVTTHWSVFHILKMCCPFLSNVISSHFPFVLWLYNDFIPCLSLEWDFERKEIYVFKYFVNITVLNAFCNTSFSILMDLPVYEGYIKNSVKIIVFPVSGLLALLLLSRTQEDTRLDIMGVYHSHKLHFCSSQH